MTQRIQRQRRAEPARRDDERQGPPLRLERIETARERIRRGYYDRADVQRALVDALLAELSV